LIDQQLLVQRAQDLGISVDTDLIKRLDDIRKEMKADSMDDLEKLAQQQGVSFEDFKQNMKNNLLTQKVISSEVGTENGIDPFEPRIETGKGLPRSAVEIRLSGVSALAPPPVRKIVMMEFGAAA